MGHILSENWLTSRFVLSFNSYQLLAKLK